jgi:glycosyltransferase involved in cell wall biosynthesis|tara:strand:+ start:4684 stop:5859 length:1176 start_codon:yes stop_codon:yes gene_type:complete
MPKILRIINRFNIGGPTYNVAYLTKFLSDKYETVLIGGEPEEGEVDSLHVLDELGIKPRIIPELKRKPNLRDDIKAYQEIRKIIREFKPDIVHTHAAKAGAVGRIAAIRSKVPIVVHTFHGHVFDGYFSPIKTKVFILIERWLAKRSTGIVAISILQKKDLAEVYKITSPEKIRIVPLGFDLKKFQNDLTKNRTETRANYKIEEDEIALAIVGRLAPIKNHELFLDALRIVQAQSTKKIKAFIVGDGLEREKLEEIALSTKQNENFSIVFTSWIKEIDKFNAGMDIFCLTSLNEGTPVSLIEAQAANIPVVSTDVGGVKDVIQENETGFLVPSGNTKMFAEKLLLLIENENIRKKMSQNGWTYVRERYDYRTLVANMESYYDDLQKLKNEK